MRTRTRTEDNVRTTKRLPIILSAVVAMAVLASPAAMAGKPDPSRAFEMEMHLGVDGDFVIGASGPAVETGVLCSTADELTREDMSNGQRMHLYVLFACDPYTPWDEIEGCTVYESPCSRPSDICHLAVVDGGADCFTLKLTGKSAAGSQLNWLLYSGLDGSGKGEVIGASHYRFGGRLK